MLSPVLKPLSNSNKYVCLSEAVNQPTTNLSTSYVFHSEAELSDLKSTQYTLETLTPVNASSLYWLI